MTGSPHRPALRLDTDDRAIRFSERDVADATRLLSAIATAKPEPRAMPPPHGLDVANPLRARARQLYEERQRRALHFGSDMFGEPAWDMLLILYLEHEGERKSQARLVELSGASRSTGQRWVDHLVRRNLAKREDHPTDKRRNFISLSDKGRDLLELYLSETCV